MQQSYNYFITSVVEAAFCYTEGQVSLTASVSPVLLMQNL